MWELDVPDRAEPVGYRFLLEHFNIEALPHYRWSYITSSWDSKVYRYDDIGLELHLYPRSYKVDKYPLKHIEFALKHEGMNFSILKHAFSKIESEELITYILASPTGAYARKIWFLYEFLLEVELPIKNALKGNYIQLLNPDEYYTGVGKRSTRHRIIDNFLGNVKFSPLVRRSPRLKQFEKKDLYKVADQLTKRFNEDVLARTIRYLYTKETIASWEIEREKPDKSKIARFVSLLQQDHATNELSKRFLIMIQKEIVDPRFLLEDYREFQNYVGEEPGLNEILVHYIAPKPQDLSSLMDGLIDCATRLLATNMDPVVIAAVLSFGFVFMHPFWDGNGRLHRFLIHYVLSKKKLTPQGIVFPISAVMLREHKEYDNALEYFSKPLSKIIRGYEINELGEMTVQQETKNFYQYIDFTRVAEYLYECVDETIHTDLELELDFLSRYDLIKRSIKEIVDMPDREIDLFIKCVRQNKGTLSLRKRESLFNMLTEREISQMEEAIKKTRQFDKPLL